MHKTSIIVALASATVLFSGCGVSASQSNDAGHGSNVAVSSSTKGAGASDKASANTQSGVAKFGTAYAYKDGLSLTVSAPQAYKPSQYAAGTEGFTTFVSFQVRLVNKTGKAWDPSLFTATVQSGNKEGSQVFDDTMQGAPRTTLLNGRESEFTVAYGVADPKDIVMEVQPDMLAHDPVVFQS